MLTRRKFLATTAYTMAAARLYAHGQNKNRVALSIPNKNVPSQQLDISAESGTMPGQVQRDSTYSSLTFVG